MSDDVGQIFGYTTRLVLIDSKGRRLAIKSVYAQIDRDVVSVDLPAISHAISAAERTGRWGDNPPTRKDFWEIEDA